MLNRITTANDIKSVMGRGTYQEVENMSIRISVPFYRVRYVNNQLMGRAPAILRFKVTPLNFWDTLFLWSIKEIK